MVNSKMFLAAAALALSAAPAHAKWVASWTASPQASLGTEGRLATARYDDVTISQILRISEGGNRVRVRFSNRYGPAMLEIGKARIFRIDDNGREITGTSRVLTFGGNIGAMIPRGAPFASDVVDLELPDLSRVKVEFYLPSETGPCTCHQTGLDTLAVSPPGDHVGETWEPVSTAQSRAFLHTVEVESDDALGTIVAYGDSITDGVGSTIGENRRWPDILANRLQEAGLEYAIANAAISGNRLLSPGVGEGALARFDEDVLSLPNVTHLIVFIGVNDLGMSLGTLPEGLLGLEIDRPPVTAEHMIAGYRQLIARARAKGISIIGSPIGPFKGAMYWTEEGEAARQTINDWIVNSGEFDAVVRFDTAFSDPADPQRMRDGFHMGDHLHGSDEGLNAVAKSIPLDLFDPN